MLLYDDAVSLPVITSKRNVYGIWLESCRDNDGKGVRVSGSIDSKGANWVFNL